MKVNQSNLILCFLKLRKCKIIIYVLCVTQNTNLRFIQTLQIWHSFRPFVLKFSIAFKNYPNTLIPFFYYSLKKFKHLKSLVKFYSKTSLFFYQKVSSWCLWKATILLQLHQCITSWNIWDYIFKNFIPQNFKID